MHQVNIFIHVIAGGIGMIIGLIPFFAIKGSRVHIHWGRVFLIFMSIVIVTAGLGVAIFRDRPFLTVVTIQSFYMTTTGYLALKYKERGPKWLEFALLLITAFIAVQFLISMSNSNVLWNKGIVYYILGYLFLFMAYDLLRIFGLVKFKKDWLLEHLLKMTSAYNALLSAGLGTVFQKYAPYNQFMGAVIGTILIVYVIYWFVKNAKRQKFESL